MLALACVACGSSGEGDDDDDSSGSSATSVGGVTTGPGISTGTSGATTAGTTGGTFSGGLRPITAEEEAAIEDVSCAGWNAEPEPLPSRLMMVVDVSSSMSQEAPGGGGTKWEVTREALLTAVGNLPASSSAGLLLYPNMVTNPHPANAPGPSTDCINTNALIPFDLLGPPGAPHRQLVLDTLDEAELNTGTPTHDAYKTALDSVLATPAAGTNTFMLLITDGQPTLSFGCANDNPFSGVPEGPIVDEVARGFGQGVRTFLIGSPGSEVGDMGQDMRPWLSYAAEVGGTSKGNCSHNGEPYCHLDMTTEDNFGEALNAALAGIVGQVVQCSYSFPTPPAGEVIDPNRINVVYTPASGERQLVLRSSDPNCTEGYYLTAANQVELCAATCDQVMADATASINVHFGCGIIVDTVPE